ncbi:uncharacterized protein LOC128309310, partial [Anopheles moucheti]|uniref:uncharacterized protein LOC128309310 n=1 Tax=Anopheles moucheti TaxID=186751 RepID=UPI0022F0E493
MSNTEETTFSQVQATSSPIETQTSMAGTIERYHAHIIRRMESLKAVLDSTPDADVSYLKECTEQLKSIASSFERKYTAVMETSNSVQTEEEERQYAEFEQRRFELSVVLKRREAALCASASVTHVSDVSNPKSKVRLPEIPLPKFEGTLETWPTFRDAFSSMIDQHPSLSDVDKLIYLKRVVSKEAAQVIEAVETTAANYNIAWELLKSRYENKKVLVRRYLEELFSIPLAKRESFESLTNLLDGFERAIKMVEKVGVDTNGWSVLLAHMLCDRLDGNTRKQWEIHHRSVEVAEYTELVQFLKQHVVVLQALPQSKEPALSNTHIHHGRQKLKQACATMKVDHLEEK